MAGEHLATIKIRGDSKEAVEALKKVTEAINNMDRTVKQKASGGAFKDFLGGMGLKGVGFAAVGAGLALVGKKAVEAAAELESLNRRAQAVFGESFGRITAESEKMAAAM